MKWAVHICRYTLALLCGLAAAPCALADSFIVKSIRVDGLERIDVGAVYQQLPVHTGESFSTRDAPLLLKNVYQTGYFKDVRLARDGDVLVVTVHERPAIGRLTVTGNEDIKSKDLLSSLKAVGIAKGHTFDESVLGRMEHELEQQYFARGKYGVRINSTVTALDRNRVAIAIEIAEGLPAKIRQIRLVGNSAFTEDALKKNFTSSEPSWTSWLTKNDQYSREKLAGDMEVLRSFYLDSGYLGFNIDSSQVAITPDKKDIYITMNLSEGKPYTVSNVSLSGRLILSEAKLKKLIVIQPGQLFSRRLVTQTTKAIAERLGQEGYAFAKVNAVPELDEEKKTVALTFFIDPGKRIYVRHIIFKGNHITDTLVLRREMRQMESMVIATEKVQQSRKNLMLLGFFTDVSIEVQPVVGRDDQVDLIVTVKEQPSGQLTGGVGYSQVDGILFNLGIAEKNFLGTGKMVNFDFNRSSAFTSYRVSYNNPYYTLDGVSRGFDLYYQETDLEETNISNFTRDAVGGTMTMGIPLSEQDRVTLGLNVENTTIRASSNASTVSNEVRNFLANEGDEFLVYKLRSRWTHNNLDRAIFPTSGDKQTVAIEAAIPSSDLQFYKISSTSWYYLPLYKGFILSLNADAAFGDGYGKTSDFPFFENFYGGGFGSVRGYKTNTLGPRDSLNEPLGGNLLVAGSMELIFPTPFIEESSTVRTTVFFDAGNVYTTLQSKQNDGGLRFSVGTSLQWMSPIGPFVFSLAKPLNSRKNDEEEVFQFTIGTLF